MYVDNDRNGGGWVLCVHAEQHLSGTYDYSAVHVNNNMVVVNTAH